MLFEEFLELTPKEFFNALWEREKHEEQIVMAQIKTICNTIRLQTIHLVNVQLPKGKKVKNVKQLMKFSWDRESARPTQTQEEMKATMKNIAKFLGSRPSKDKENDNRRRRR